MDIHPNIVNWLQEMGYNEQIPDSLVGICNNSTKFIWEQLLANVRPKQEVEFVKKNIILNRLKIKPLSKQGEFGYKVKEIENFKQKLDLEQKLKVMSELVQEKKYKVDHLSQKCRIKDISLDFLKKNIKETEHRNYLLQAKKEQLELQNSQANQSLKKLKNVTPVEREDSSSTKEITETLEKCAEKLSKLYTESQKSISRAHKPSYYSAKKVGSHNHTSVAAYLSIQEKEDFEEITRSCRKVSKDKENIDVNIQDEHGKVKQRLFCSPQVIIECPEKDSCTNSYSDTFSFGQTNSGAGLVISKPKQRESLGLLPDTCFDAVDKNDSFLQVIGNTTRYESVFSELDDSIRSVETRISQNSNNSDDSVVFNFKVPQQRKFKKPSKISEDLRSELYHNITVNRELEELLHKNNRELIYETLQKCISNIIVNFTKVICTDKKTDERNRLNEDDIAKLWSVHIQTELKILQQKKILKDLVAKIGRQKLQVLSSIKSRGNFIELQEWLEASIKQVALDATLDAIKKEINFSNITDDDDSNLQVMTSRIMKVKSEITHKLHLIQSTIDDLYGVQKNIATTRESVLIPIWHVRMFKTDTDWMTPLLENTWSDEIIVFRDFPLEYQRRCVHTDPKVFYRDLCVDNYPHHVQLSSDEMQLLVDILESPFSPPETILLSVIKAKMKMNLLKSLKSKSPNNSSFIMQQKKKHSFDELRQQESYLDFAIDRLKSLMLSTNASKTLSIGETVKRAMDIWTEMPMKGFISDKRLFEEQNYRFFEDKLNRFL